MRRLTVLSRFMIGFVLSTITVAHAQITESQVAAEEHARAFAVAVSVSDPAVWEKFWVEHFGPKMLEIPAEAHVVGRGNSE